MLLLIDNFDSFTYNLVHEIEKLHVAVTTTRCPDFPALLRNPPAAILIGPGPGAPHTSTHSLTALSLFQGTVPILGVCLGHQCIAHYFGGRVTRAARPMHGKTSAIYHNDSGCFAGLPQGFLATRYHSLTVERHSLPDCLEITAETSEGEVMGIRHKTLPIEGVQFHPEAVLSEEGPRLFHYFIQLTKQSSPLNVCTRR